MPSPSFWVTYAVVAATTALVYVTGLAAWFAGLAASALISVIDFAIMAWGENRALILGFVAFQCAIFVGVALQRSPRR